MSTKNQFIWHLISDFELLWRCWDNEYVVYHSGTGDTHLLNQLAASVLESLQQSPADIHALSRKLAAEYDITPDDEFVAAMNRLISDLNKFGLIEQANI